MTKYSIPLTTDASGAATGYTPTVYGRIHAVQYVKTDFADGVDFVVTTETTGETVVTLTNQNVAGTFYPRIPVHDELGAVATFDGTRKVREAARATFERVKVAVTQGGDTKGGVVNIFVE